MQCPKCGKAVEELYLKAGEISTATVTDFSIIDTPIAKVTGREARELRYFCKNCATEFSESEVIRETVGILNLPR